MQYPWLDEYCLSMKGASKVYKEEWAAFLFLLGDKMFLMAGEDKESRPILTVKLPPELGHLMRQEYPDIVPGYYMNKEHWNSIYRDGTVPDEVVKDLLQKSYEAVLASLSKKRQKELLET